MWCENPARIRCMQCSPAIFMCTECDNRVHTHMPFHNREAWVNIHFTPIPPTCTLDDFENSTFKTIRMLTCFHNQSVYFYVCTYMLLHAEKTWPLRILQRCPKCQKVGSFKKIVISGERRILVTCDGMKYLSLGKRYYVILP